MKTGRPREVKQISQDHTAHQWLGFELGSSGFHYSPLPLQSRLLISNGLFQHRRRACPCLLHLLGDRNVSPALALASGSVCCDQRLWLFRRSAALQLKDQWTVILTRRFSWAQWETPKWSDLGI